MLTGEWLFEAFISQLWLLFVSTHKLCVFDSYNDGNDGDDDDDDGDNDDDVAGTNPDDDFRGHY